MGHFWGHFGRRFEALWVSVVHFGSLWGFLLDLLWGLWGTPWGHWVRFGVLETSLDQFNELVRVSSRFPMATSE